MGGLWLSSWDPSCLLLVLDGDVFRRPQGAPQGVSTCRDGSRGPSPWCEFGRQVGRLELGRWQQPLPEPPRGRLLLCLPQHGVRRCQAALGRRALPRPWSAVLLDDPHPRVCRLAFHALGKYHHWLACWLHRRGPLGYTSPATIESAPAITF